MSNKLYNESDIQAIATSIRSKNGTQNTYTVSQMPQAILDIPTGSQSYNNGKNNFWVYVNPNKSVLAYITNQCEVDWGDGTVETLSTNTSHIYTNAGIYIISGEYVMLQGDLLDCVYVECNKGSVTNTLSPSSKILKTILNRNTATITSMFASCSNLQEVYLLNAISIEQSTFQNCSSLETVYIPKIANIGDSAFLGCSSLKNITIPASVISIGDSAFWECTSLTTLTIPASVTSIGGNAFWKCTSMQEYHFLSTTPPILGNDYVFNNIPANCVIYVPASAVTAYQTANNWSDYASYIQAEPSV